MEKILEIIEVILTLIIGIIDGLRDEESRQATLFVLAYLAGTIVVEALLINEFLHQLTLLLAR